MRGRKTRCIALSLSALLLTGVAFWPVPTHSGVDYQWTVRNIPLHRKAADFQARDRETRRLVRQILQNAPDEPEILTLLRWVDQNVSPTPPGSHVYDDHLLNVVHRGHGAPDQRTEVFALLVSYSGMPGGMALFRDETGRSHYVALVQDQNRNYLIDVVRQLVFVDAEGRLADIGEASANPSAIRVFHRGREASPHQFASMLGWASTVRIDYTRIEAQKPLPRLKMELRRMVRGLDRGTSPP